MLSAGLPSGWLFMLGACGTIRADLLPNTARQTFFLPAAGSERAAVRGGSRKELWSPQSALLHECRKRPQQLPARLQDSPTQYLSGRAWPSTDQTRSRRVHGAVERPGCAGCPVGAALGPPGPGAVGGRCPRTPGPGPAQPRGTSALSRRRGEAAGAGAGTAPGRSGDSSSAGIGTRIRANGLGPAPRRGQRWDPASALHQSPGERCSAAGSPLNWCSQGGCHTRGTPRVAGAAPSTPCASPAASQHFCSTFRWANGCLQHQHSMLGSSIVS